jgi:hypothetical protein
VTATVIEKDDQYVLNHCSRLLARDNSDRRHDFGQYAPDDMRATICEAWRLPVIDSHYDGSSAESSYPYNDVTFLFDGRFAGAADVAVAGTFAALHEAVPMRRIRFLGEDTGVFTVTLRVPKGEVHTYKFRVDGSYVVDPINPQLVKLDNGRQWSRFFTDACQVPLTLSRRERELLARLVAHLLPFRTGENRRFIEQVYNRIDRSARGQEFPLAYRLDEEVGVVNYIDKLLARAEQHNLDDYRTCLSMVDGILRNRGGGIDPLMLGPEQFEQLYGEMAGDNVDGWDKGRYGSPAYFLLLVRRHAMTGAFAHPKSGGNSGGAGWMYLESRFRDERDNTLFDWRRAIEAPLGRNTDYRG